MSGHQVVVQGIEFQNLVVSASIFCEIEPGIEAERKGESNDKIEIDAETECGDEEPVVVEARRKSRRGLLGGFVSQLASWLNHRSVVSRPSLDTPAEETEVEGKFASCGLVVNALFILLTLSLQKKPNCGKNGSGYLARLKSLYVKDQKKKRMRFKRSSQA